MAANDVISLARAKLFLQVPVSDTTRDAQVQAFVSSVSNAMDQYCGPVIQRTVTNELVDGGGSSPPVVMGGPLTGKRVIRVRHWPVASYTTVVEYQAGSPTTLVQETPTVAGDYLADGWEGSSVWGLYSGRLFRRVNFNDSTWRPGRRNISVTYVAGRFANTAAAQDTMFERAAALWLRVLWAEQQLNVGAAGAYDVPMVSYPKQIPDVVPQMLFGEWRESGIGVG